MSSECGSLFVSAQRPKLDKHSHAARKKEAEIRHRLSIMFTDTEIYWKDVLTSSITIGCESSSSGHSSTASWRGRIDFFYDQFNYIMGRSSLSLA
jgi:hypothetical protein